MAAPKAVNFEDTIILFSHKGIHHKFLVHVGDECIIHYDKPSNKRERSLNKRVVSLVGFDADFCGNPIVKDVTGGRQFIAPINNLIPLSELELVSTMTCYEYIVNECGSHEVHYMDDDGNESSVTVW